MALIWVPGRRAWPSKTGTEELVAVHTMSASATAASGVGATAMSCGMPSCPCISSIRAWARAGVRL
jgi:hypothetical protein